MPSPRSPPNTASRSSGHRASPLSPPAWAPSIPRQPWVWQAGSGIDGTKFEPGCRLPTDRRDLRAMAEDRLAYDANIAWIDERVPHLNVPSVTLLATADRPIPLRHGRRLAGALPDTHTIEVPGGHMLPVVQP